MKLIRHWAVLFLLLPVSCKLRWYPVQTEAQVIAIPDTLHTRRLYPDTLQGLAELLKPYRDSMKQSMEVIIGSTLHTLHKEKPSGSLGHMVVDALFDTAYKLEPRTAICIMNYGGLRLPDLPAGPITRSKIYELLPFDNELVWVKMNGNELIHCLQKIAQLGGYPIAVGKPLLQSNNNMPNRVYKPLQVFHGKLQQPDCTANAEPCLKIQDSIVYEVATIDYLANGGDNFDFLKKLPRRQSGLLLRNIVLQTIQQQQVLQADTLARWIIKP